MKWLAVAAPWVLVACLSTESGNPEANSQTASDPSVAASVPRGDGPGVIDPAASQPVQPSAQPSSVNSGSSPVEPPCEYTERSDAGGPDDAAAVRVYRCGLVDGGVGCTCGSDLGAAGPALLLPRGEHCDQALLEHCGRILR